MHRAVIDIFVLSFFIFTIACDNPFATREPEPPSTIQSNWIQPTSTTIVLANLSNAIEEKNKSNYLRCFADTSVSSKDYVFVPDPAVLAANPGVFSQWNKEAEANYVNQLYSYLPKDSLITVKFTRETDDIDMQDSIIVRKNYTVKMHDRCDADNCIETIIGLAEFRMIRTQDDLWYIYRWRDESVSDSLTWSDHKARFGK
jgi:hypothetical protein